jgi:hypothetical protein
VEPINLQNGDYIKLYSSGAGVKVALTLAENTDVAGATTSDDLAEGTTNLYLTSAERTKLSGIATGAEVNQNAFSNVAVSGQTTVAADAKTDTLTLVAGTGVTLTTDAATDSITIAASGSSSNSFETIAVAGQSSVVADSGTDTLTLVAGTGITITTDAGADSVTITNSATGANAFGNVAVSGQSTVAADSTNDTLTLAAGTGITLTTDASTDTVTITNSVTAPNTFGTIAVATQSNVVADSTTDTLTFAVGGGMTITTNATTDTITFDSANLDNDDVTLQGAREIELNGETLTIFDGFGDLAVWNADTSLLYNLEVSAQVAANGAAVKLYEASDNGTNYVSLAVNSTLASNVTFTLPTSNGTNGYVLQTDGSGNTSWVAASGGASYSAVRTQSGTTYTLVLGDAGDYIQTTSTTAVTITVPPQADVTWAADTEIYFEQNNTGQITIAAGSGVTINSSETLKSFARYSVIALKRVAENVWTLTGERALV